MINPHIVRKTTSPINPPPEAGIHWINTSTGQEWFSVGTATAQDWVLRNPVAGAAGSLTATVYNNSGVTIPKGSVIYINGQAGNLPTIALAQANTEATSSKTFGMTAEDIGTNNSGTVVHNGVIGNLDTNGLATGVALYLSPTVPGGYTTTKPSAPNHMVFIGICTRASATQGTIELFIQNGFELQELHNVAISSPTTGQTITYDSGTSLWSNHTLTKSDVGLNNVDNTSDLNKPVSTATQSALNLKQDTITGAATSVTSANLTADRVLSSDGSGKIAVTPTTTTTLGYLDVSSSLTTLLAGKEPTLTKGNLTESTSSVLTVTGGTDAVIGSGTQLTVKKSSATQDGYLAATDFSTFAGKQDTITGAATSITSSNLTPSVVVVSNGSGKIASSSVSTTTLGYLDATSSVQTQLNARALDSDVIKKDGSVAFTADQSMGTHRINDVVDPLLPQSVATKNYVDNLITGLDWKAAAHVATVANINLASAPATIDGHPVNNLDRVLVKDQSAPAENGIYVWNGAGVAMTRSADADTWNEIVHAIVFVEQGLTNGGSKWNNTNVAGGTLGVTAVTFTLFSSTGSLAGTGTNNYNAYWTGPSTLSSEQYVAQSRGGLGTDSSAFTGVVKASSGSFSASALADADVSATAAISMSKLAPLTASRATVTDASGVLTSSAATATEVGYLSGVTSGIQSQISAKQDTITGAATSVTSSNLTASRAVVSDGSGKIASSSATATEVGYLSGVSSAIQTQIDSKEPTLSKGNLSESTSAVLTVTGGTGSVIGSGTTIEVKQSSGSQSGYLSSTDWTTFNGKQAAITGGASSITSSNLTLSRALVSDAAGKVAVSSTTSAELGYVSGVTSAIQTQLNSKEPTLTKGNLTEATSSVLTISGGTGSVIGSGTSVQVKQAGAAQDGYLSGSDWNSFDQRLGPVEVSYTVRVTLGSATLGGDNGMTSATSGTAALNTFSGATTLGKWPHVSYSTTSTAGSTAGFRTATTYFCVGGGFKMSHIFQINDAAPVANARHFLGANTSSSATAINGSTNNNPLVNSLTNFFAFACDAGAGDTNFCIYHNGNTAGATTRVSLGASFPIGNSGEFYQVEFYNPLNSFNIYYRVKALVAGVTTNGVIVGTVSNLPTNNQLYFHNERFNAGTGLATKFDACSMGLYTSG